MTEEPIVDQIAKDFASKLSLETQLKIYQDLREEMGDTASDVMDTNSIEEALNDFAFQVFWRVQHRLLYGVMSEEEIEGRVYKNPLYIED